MSLVNKNRKESNSLNFFGGFGRIGTSLILLILLVSTSAKAQRLDSISYTYHNDTLSVYVRVFDYISFDFGNIKSQESGKVLTVDICMDQWGTQAEDTKDTLIAVVPQQPLFDLVVNLFMDGRKSSCADSVPVIRKTFRNIVSIDDQHLQLQSEFYVFPNPATGNIRLDVSDGLKIEEIRLFNLAGKSVKKFNPTARNIDVSEVPMGLYFLKVKTPEGVLTKKVLIE